MNRNRMSKTFVFTLLVLLFMFTIMLMPRYGSFQNKHVAEYYIENASVDTGSANVVNSIVWDYRGYDTLGEETVLFAAALGVLIVIRREKR